MNCLVVLLSLIDCSDVNPKFVTNDFYYVRSKLRQPLHLREFLQLHCLVIKHFAERYVDKGVAAYSAQLLYVLKICPVYDRSCPSTSHKLCIHHPTPMGFI
jgi:hypothetical protein